MLLGSIPEGPGDLLQLLFGESPALRTERAKFGLLIAKIGRVWQPSPLSGLHSCALDRSPGEGVQQALHTILQKGIKLHRLNVCNMQVSRVYPCARPTLPNPARHWAIHSSHTVGRVKHVSMGGSWEASNLTRRGWVEDEVLVMHVQLKMLSFSAALAELVYTRSWYCAQLH